MYAQNQQTIEKDASAIRGYGSGVVSGAALGYTSAPTSPTTALHEASEALDRSISECMSLAEMVADRLNPLLQQVPQGVGTNGADKLARTYSPYVETVNRQRSRVDAISAQLRDLLSRLEV